MTTKPVLIKEAILVDQNITDLNQSIDLAGKLLLDNGYIDEEYIESMKEKVLEHPYTTYLPGAGVAIPHGMSDGFKYIKHTGISVLQIPNGLNWLDEKVYIIIAIAANSDEHMNVLASLSDALESEEDAQKLWTTNSVDKLFEILSN
ncbi:MAG: hypothetical protein CL518_01315 [Actinobacteria bacterium]|nr:hypothetical protein [Actinomycetota bacterium]|tara:strand:- start:214 stop:654 length:441 start_codon:yes stop_codon:yes gene_type:complete